MSEGFQWAPRDTDLQVSWSGTVEEIDAEWEKLHAQDKAAEAKRSRYIAAGIVLMVVGVLASLITDSGDFMTAALFVMMFMFIMARRAGSGDTEDHKLAVVRTLLDTFASELRPGSSLDVTLDFRGYWHYERGQSWMTMKMTLDNGVVAQLSLRDSCKRKTRPKVKYNKIKDKVVQTFVVRFVPPKGQTLPPDMQLGRRTVSVGSLGLRQFKVAPRSATFVFATDPIVRIGRRDQWVVLSNHTIPTTGDLVGAMIGSYHLLGYAGARAATAQA